MKTRSFILWLMIVFLLPGYSTFAYNYLSVQDPRNWRWNDGTIEAAVLSVHPVGLYMQFGLYLTFSARNTQFTGSDTLEIQFYFDLPEEAIVHDLWLWVGEDIIRAQILDKWKASSIYENIVKRRRDPAILFKEYDNQYQLRIYPMAGNQTRKVKITYLVPTQWLPKSVTAPIEIDLLQQVSKNRLNYLNIIFWPDQEWLNPNLIELPDISFTAMEDSLSELYYTARVPLNTDISSLNLATDSPLKDGIYLNYLNWDYESYYQLVVLPSEVMDLTSKRKVALLFDYDINKTTLSAGGVLATVKNVLHQRLAPADSFNLFFSGLTIKKAGDNWYSGDSTGIEQAFANAGANPISSYSNLPSLFKSGIEFINSKGGDGNLLLIAASDQVGDYQVANPLMEDILDLMDPVIPVHVADIQNTNFQYYYFGNRYFYGNEYFYDNLSRRTGGEYTRLLWNEDSFYNILSTLFESLGGFISSFDLYTSLQNGFCYGRLNLWPENRRVYLEQPLRQLGKFIGEFPFEIKTSGMYKSEPFISNIQIPADQISEGDSVLVEMWTGTYIQSLESQEASNDVITEIVDYSLKERILSLYTAFLALEPSDSVQPCIDCNDESDMVKVEELVKTSVTSDTLLKAYPNPFNSTISIKIRLSKNYNSKEIALKIYNVMGQTVKNFDIPSYHESSEIEVVWNGLNDQGGMVSSGTYFFVMETPTKRHALKILYLK